MKDFCRFVLRRLGNSFLGILGAEVHIGLFFLPYRIFSVKITDYIRFTWIFALFERYLVNRLMCFFAVMYTTYPRLFRFFLF